MTKKYPQSAQIKQIIDAATDIVIVQADNPDGDSLASSLALEAILGQLGKRPHLYCGIEMPTYLRYLPGWDRVSSELPKKFDASVIVDTSNLDLLDTLVRSGQKGWLAAKPCIVLDHHAVEANLDFATVICNQPVVSTGELIFELCQQLNWPLPLEAGEMLAVSIMSDSLGLITEATSARSIEIISLLVGQGVSLAKIDSERRMLMRKSPELVAYKGRLLQRVQYHHNNRVATVDIPWDEIQQYSPSYNPSMLVIDDMRMTEGTEVAIAFKSYPDGKVTAKIRCNYNAPIANQLASQFGGGGHQYASGFKVTSGQTLSQLKAQAVQLALELLDKAKAVS